MRIPCFLVLVVSLFVGGCGGGDAQSSSPTDSVSDDERAKVDSIAEIKQRLQEISASGQGGSSVIGLRPSIEALQATDAAKAQQLLTDLDNLESAQTPEQVKQIATRMAAKL